MNSNIEYRVTPGIPTGIPGKTGRKRRERDKIRRGPIIINDDSPAEIPSDKQKTPYRSPYYDPRLRRDDLPPSNDFPKNYRYL